MENVEVITHTTRTRPRLKERVKILFGATIVVNSEIIVDKPVQVFGSSAKDEVKWKE